MISFRHWILAVLIALLALGISNATALWGAAYGNMTGLALMRVLTSPCPVSISSSLAYQIDTQDVFSSECANTQMEARLWRASAHLARAILQDSNGPTPAFLQAAMCKLRGCSEGEVQIVVQMEGGSQQRPLTQLLLGDIYYVRQDYSAALERWQAARGTRWTVSRALGGASRWLASGQVSQAEAVFSAALALDPSPDTYYGIAYRRMPYYGFDSRVRQMFETGLRLDNRESARRYEAQGLYFLWSGDAPAASDWLRRAVELSPGSYWARIYYAESLTGYGQLDLAEAQYREALRISPEAALPHARLAALYAERGEVGRAIKELEIGVQKSPKDSRRRFDLARMYEEAGRVEEAAEQYHVVLTFDPDDAQARAALDRLG